MNIFYRNNYMRSYEKRLIEENKKYWLDKPAVFNGEKWIYVFHGLECELEFTVYENIVAKALQQKMNLPIISITYGNGTARFDNLDASFGIKDIIHLTLDTNKRLISIMKINIIAKFLAYVTFKNKEKLLNLKYRGILCGDVIYDEIIRMNNDIKFDCFNISCDLYCSYIKKALYTIDKSYKLFKKKTPKYIITTEPVYIKSLFLSVASFLGSEIIITSTDFPKIITQIPSRKFYAKRIKMSDIISKRIEACIKKKQIIRGNEENLFVMKTENETNDNILETLGIANKKKNIFIMLHALNDVPRFASYHNIYNDYNEWFIDTLRIIKDVKDVNWIIKDHPQSEFYHQGEYVKEIFEQNKMDHIYWCDKSISGMKIKEIADCIVTCAGDVGIEYWAYGVPTITVSNAYYCKWNISYNMKSLKQYESALRNIKNIKKPTTQSVKRAQKYLTAYKNIMESEDCLTNLFREIRIRQLNNFKNGKLEDDVLHSMFCQKYIDLLKDDKIKSSVIYQLDNVYEV